MKYQTLKLYNEDKKAIFLWYYDKKAGYTFKGLTFKSFEWSKKGLEEALEFAKQYKMQGLKELEQKIIELEREV